MKSNMYKALVPVTKILIGTALVYLAAENLKTGIIGISEALDRHKDSKD